MARIARVIVPGFPHHVTQRGNRRLPTFFSNEDYEAYRALVAEWCAKHADHSRGQLSAGRARWAAARNGTRGGERRPGDSLRSSPGVNGARVCGGNTTVGNMIPARRDFRRRLEPRGVGAGGAGRTAPLASARG